MKPAIEGEGENLSFIESMYDHFVNNPSQLDPTWQRYFQSLDSSAPLLSPEPKNDKNDAACKIDQLIRAYRREGHLAARINSLSNEIPTPPTSLSYQTYGFTSTDLNTFFPTEGILLEKKAPLSKIVEALQRLYCGPIGFEYEGIVPRKLETWLKERIEQDFFLTPLTREQKVLIMESLNRSELLENFLHTKFVGQKRFSLEGAETLIPMLALLLEKAGEEGVEEVVMGMSHRGRLNVLSNILNKPYTALLEEFKDNHLSDSVEGMGDVKYHKGHMGDYLHRSAGRKIKLTLCPNPSHLESVDAVVEGTVRAKQVLNQDEDERCRVIPILIHGDAAVSGQGVVYETLQLSQLQGYKTGGTIHYVLNNHIGFTTLPRDMRSTFYATDIAKTFSIPIFHVNAEDPENCVKISLLALEIRQKFHCDVFIEFNCYRKYGHNEGDEPTYTQPVQYKVIKSKKPIRVQYRDHLLENNIVSKKDVDKLEIDFKKGLQEAHVEGEKNSSFSEWVKENRFR